MKQNVLIISLDLLKNNFLRCLLKDADINYIFLGTEWMVNALCSLVYLSTLFPAGGALWESCGTIGR